MLSLNQSIDNSKWSNLTHLSLVVILWAIEKQHSPRCDAASGAIVFAQCHQKSDKIKITPYTPKNESGLQLILMGKSIRQIWVNIKTIAIAGIL